MSDDTDYWERTWKERSDILSDAYGDTEPSGTVQAFSWPGRIRLPGACSVAFPPIHKTSAPPRHARDQWLHLSIGLTQPLGRKQVERERAAGKSYSAYGFEIGILTEHEVKWASPLLYLLLTAITDGEDIKWGDRFPFRFYQRDDGSQAVILGGMKEAKPERKGKLCALLFWPYLFPHAEFCSSTGKFLIMIATGITQDEWDVAKATTTEHLLLLLSRAGIGQRTLPDRESVFVNPKWQQEWKTLALADLDSVRTELALLAKRKDR